jgi:hypothetical protein
MFDPQECDRARVNRDRRYDGHFFTGVKTTQALLKPETSASTLRRPQPRRGADSTTSSNTIANPQPNRAKVR